MQAIINGQEYTLSVGYSYDKDKNRYFLSVITDSVDELIEVLGDAVTLEIPNEFVVAGLTMDSVTKVFEDGVSICKITLKKYPYEDVLKTQADDIEILSQAIVELAEIIGGGEEA